MTEEHTQEQGTGHTCHPGGSRKACVSQVPIFNHLGHEQMNEIMNVVRHVSFKKGETIFGAGDWSDTLYIIHQGKVKIYRLAESGKEQILTVLYPGDFTGEYALFNESTHHDYAEAMEKTNICMIKKEHLQNFLMKYPTISLKMLTEFSKRLEESGSQTTNFATERVETRIALYLADLANKSGSETIKLPMSRHDLASYLGTSPETISRRLADLEDRGLIKQLSRTNIEIIDMDGLLLI